MIVDTPIVDPARRAAVRDVYSIADRVERTELFVSYLDQVWMDFKPVDAGYEWPAAAGELRRQMDEIRQRIGARG
jgi:hypothetical protein